MPELKKEVKALSEWVKFELETDLIDPPVIEFRLAPIYTVDVFDGVDDEGKFKFKKYYVQTVLDCTKEWNVKKGGKTIELTDEVKQRHLMPLLSAKVKGKNTMLITEIYNHASNLDNFVKN